MSKFSNLPKDNGSGESYTEVELKADDSVYVCWIPSKLAKLNKNIVVDKENISIDYVISKVYGSRKMTDEQVSVFKTQHLKQARISDI